MQGLRVRGQPFFEDGDYSGTQYAESHTQPVNRTTPLNIEWALDILTISGTSGYVYPASGTAPNPDVSGVATTILMFPEKIQLQIRASISKDIDICRGEIMVDMKQLNSIAKPLVRKIRNSAEFWENQIRKAEDQKKGL